MPKFIDKVVKADGGKVVDLVNVNEDNLFDPEEFTGLGNYVLPENIKGVYNYNASINITSVPTANGNISITCLGSTYQIPVYSSSKSIYTLKLGGATSAAIAAGSVYILFNGTLYTVAVTTSSTILTVLNAISSLSIDGFTITNDGASTVTFTANNVGSTKSPIFGSGATNISGIFDEVQVGADAYTPATLAAWIAEQGIAGLNVSASGSIVTINCTTLLNTTDLVINTGGTGIGITSSATCTSLSTNVLLQEQFANTNTQYVIRQDFDLCGQTITMPSGCSIIMEGGTLSNGQVIGNYSTLKADVHSISILNNIIFTGQWWGDYIVAEWFGAVGGVASNNAVVYKYLQLAINNAKYSEGRKVRLMNTNYYTGDHQLELINYVRFTSSTQAVILSSLTRNDRSAVHVYTLTSTDAGYDTIYGNMGGRSQFGWSKSILVDGGYLHILNNNGVNIINADITATDQLKGSGVTFDASTDGHSSIQGTTVRNLEVGYFNRNINIVTQNYYLNTFDNLISKYGFIGIYNPTGYINSGENIQFTKCVIHQNFIAVYDNSQGGVSGLNFHDCSFDFNQCLSYFAQNSAYYGLGKSQNITYDNCWIEGTGSVHSLMLDIYGIAHGYFVKRSQDATEYKEVYPKINFTGGTSFHQYAIYATSAVGWMIHSTNARFNFDRGTKFNCSYGNIDLSDPNALFLTTENIEFSYNNIDFPMMTIFGNKFISPKANAFKWNMSSTTGTYTVNSGGLMPIRNIVISDMSGMATSAVVANNILTLTTDGTTTGTATFTINLKGRFRSKSPDSLSHTLIPVISLVSSDPSITTTTESIAVNHAEKYFTDSGKYITIRNFKYLWNKNLSNTFKQWGYFNNAGYVIPSLYNGTRTSILDPIVGFSTQSIVFTIPVTAGYTTTISLSNIYLLDTERFEPHHPGVPINYNSEAISQYPSLLGESFVDPTSKKNVTLSADGLYRYPDGSQYGTSFNENYIGRNSVAQYVTLATIPLSSSNVQRYCTLLEYTTTTTANASIYTSELYYLDADNRGSTTRQVRLTSLNSINSVAINVYYYIDSSSNLIIYTYLPAYSSVKMKYLDDYSFLLSTVSWAGTTLATGAVAVPAVNSRGLLTGTLNSGTTTARPTVATNYITAGFTYYNTTTATLQTHVGSDVWIDETTQLSGAWVVTTGSVLTAATATYSKLDKQIALSGTFTFATASSAVTITLPYAPDYGVTLVVGNLTFSLTSGSTSATVTSSVATTAQTFQLNYKTA